MNKNTAKAFHIPSPRHIDFYSAYILFMFCNFCYYESQGETENKKLFYITILPQGYLMFRDTFNIYFVKHVIG